MYSLKLLYVPEVEPEEPPLCQETMEIVMGPDISDGSAIT